jgi:CRP-like cAMP-binding protein/Fe-S-cluster-containing hydrogenase component 2/thioredoxin reductase
MSKYKIAVLGSGPGGLSAAGHAAELGISHVLLEAKGKYSDTIQKYQKGKHVMAEPGFLPLRSPFAFEAGKRETILKSWGESLEQHKVNIQYNSEVIGVEGQKGDFNIKLKNGQSVSAETIIMGIGLQGNPRKVGVENDDFERVQYQLDDPNEYKDETIVVLGAGDAAIENAVGLANPRNRNKIYIVNRKDEFVRAKQGNIDLILKSADDGLLEIVYSANVGAIDLTPEASTPMNLMLKTNNGEVTIPSDRVIGRLGAIPPRPFVESCGIEFPNASPGSLPELSAQYESNVPGLYVIGALGGYPLIKQAMNQGYEVVEYILGNKINPADHPLLEAKLNGLPFKLDVDDTLKLFQERLNVFTEVNALMFREVILDSTVHTPKKDGIVFNKGDYTNTFFTIANGTVDVLLNADGTHRITIPQGAFFGEMGLLSGRRRTATIVAGEDCVLIETPRRTMKKLLSSVDQVKHVLDQTFIIRTIQTRFAPGCSIPDLLPIAETANLNEYKPGEKILSEDDTAQTFHLIRKGSVKITRALDGGSDVVTGYLSAGQYVGEAAVLSGSKQPANIIANVASETIALTAEAFNQLLEMEPKLRDEVRQTLQKRISNDTLMEAKPNNGEVLSFMLDEGLGEATNALVIDETLCVGCDNCEKACADTHDGTSRLDREAGATFAHLHLPTSCRHCEDPHCMKDCPPDAISRAANGEVFVKDTCIGCGNCVRNCPYDVIKLAAPPPKKPSLFRWLLTGAGPGPGQDPNFKPPKDVIKKAVKCDQCIDLSGGPACVRACPTGAAIRVGPEELVDMIASRKG